MVSRLKFILKPRPRLKRYRFGGTFSWTITMKVIYFIQLAIIVAVFMWSIKIIFSNFVFNDDGLALLDENVGIKGRSSGQRVELPMPEEELFPSTTTMVTTTTTPANVTTTNPDSAMATDGPSIDEFTTESGFDLDPNGQTTSIDMSTDFLSFFTENPTTTQTELDLATTQSEPADSTRSNDAESESSASTIRPEIDASTSTATTTSASTLDESSTEVPRSFSTDSGSSAGSTTGSSTENPESLQTGIPETGGGPSSTTAIDSTFDLATEVPESGSTDITLAESPQTTTTTTTTLGDTFELATEVPPSPSPEIPSTDYSTSSVASFGPAATMAVPTTESLAYTEEVVTEQAEVTDGQADLVPTSTTNLAAFTDANTQVPTAFETFDDVSTPSPNEPISSATAVPDESTERIDFEIDRTIPSSFDQNGATTTTTTSSTTIVPGSSALTEESNIGEYTTSSSNTLPSVNEVTSLDESTTVPQNSITTRSVSNDADDGSTTTPTTTPIPTTTTPTSIATNVADSGSDVPAAVNTTSRSFVEYSSESSNGVDSDTTTTTTTTTTASPNTEVTTMSPPLTTPTSANRQTTSTFSKTAPAKPNHHHNSRPKWMRFWPNNPPTGWNPRLPPCPPSGAASGPSDGGWGPSDQQEPAATMESSFFGTAATSGGSGQSITSQLHKLWTRMFRLNQFRCEISQERRVIQYGLIQALDQYRQKLSREILALSETLKQTDRWYWPNMMPKSEKVQEELIRLNQLLQLTTQYFKVLNRFNYFEWLQN